VLTPDTLQRASRSNARDAPLLPELGRRIGRPSKTQASDSLRGPGRRLKTGPDSPPTAAPVWRQSRMSASALCNRGRGRGRGRSGDGEGDDCVNSSIQWPRDSRLDCALHYGSLLFLLFPWTHACMHASMHAHSLCARHSSHLAQGPPAQYHQSRLRLSERCSAQVRVLGATTSCL
jgi:hypothetical protein